MHGVVTLSGTVPTARAKLAAHELAAATSGCRSILDELAIVTAEGLTDTEIAEQVRATIRQRIELTKGAIAVNVDAGVANLSGAVGTPEEYTIAEEAARSTRGVREVHNALIIDRDAQWDDESLRLEVQSVLASIRELRSALVSVAVSGDLIVLSGTVGSERQRLLAAEAVADMRTWRVRNEIAVESANAAG